MAWEVFVSLPFVVISIAYFAEVKLAPVLVLLLTLLIHRGFNSLLGLGFGFADYSIFP